MQTTEEQSYNLHPYYLFSIISIFLSSHGTMQCVVEDMMGGGIILRCVPISYMDGKCIRIRLHIL